MNGKTTTIMANPSKTVNISTSNTQCGTAFGWTADEEATAYPMTTNDRKKWYTIPKVMIAFLLIELFGNEIDAVQGWDGEWFY
jgi:hypothetical protein